MEGKLEEEKLVEFTLLLVTSPWGRLSAISPQKGKLKN
jgi:hypothetical protein